MGAIGPIGLRPTLVKPIYIYIYIYIYIVEEGLDGHGLLLLRVSRVMRSSDNWTGQRPSSRADVSESSGHVNTFLG